MAARHFRRWRLYAGVRGEAGPGEPELPCGLWRRLQRREHRGGPLAGDEEAPGDTLNVLWFPEGEESPFTLGDPMETLGEAIRLAGE